MTNPLLYRPRRLRLNPLLRIMLHTTRLAPSDFVAPLFIRLGKNVKTPIPSMPGVFQFSPDTALTELRRLVDLGLTSTLLFGITDSAAKDPAGSHALDPNNAVNTTMRAAKDAKLHILLIPDLCFCEYTSHGHCGPLTQSSALSPQSSTVDNDLTATLLGKQAVIHVQNGADVVAPSAMMDHQIHAIRAALDAANFHDTPILSYAVKYASSFYGPFRDAAESPPSFGDRKSYQMDYRRSPQEALLEAQQDLSEGADMLMVKPAMPYLDILAMLTQHVTAPVAAYHVSGEYAMLKAAAQNGWIDERGTVLETMTSLKRAGAAFVLTYYAAELAGWIK